MEKISWIGLNEHYMHCFYNMIKQKTDYIKTNPYITSYMYILTKDKQN